MRYLSLISFQTFETMPVQTQMNIRAQVILLLTGKYVVCLICHEAYPEKTPASSDNVNNHAQIKLEWVQL